MQERRQGCGLSVVKLTALGLWIWAIVAGSVVHRGDVAAIVLLAALLFTAWGMAENR